MPGNNKLETEPPLTPTFTNKAVSTDGTEPITPLSGQQQPQQRPISAFVIDQQWFGNRG